MEYLLDFHHENQPPSKPLAQLLFIFTFSQFSQFSKDFTFNAKIISSLVLLLDEKVSKINKYLYIFFPSYSPSLFYDFEA